MTVLSDHRVRFSAGPRPDDSFSWNADHLRGRLTELSEPRAAGALTLLARWLLQVQTQDEAAAWVAAGPTVFCPADLVFRGIDPRGITVVRPPAAQDALPAADLLTRSGAFGLVVVDGLPATVAEGDLGRLSRLAERHGTAVVLLTRKEAVAPSLGSQVNLRLGVEPAPGGLEATVLKDKRRGPGDRLREAYRGPLGLY